MSKNQVTGVILAGGRARRMGGEDKGLVQINNQAMISYVIDALHPQVAAIVLNINRNESTYRKFGYPIVADDLAGFQGPLAGMAAAMARVSTEYIFTCPCDGPLLARDIVARLFAAMAAEGGDICVPHDGDRLQSVCALIDCRLRESLLEYLTGKDRKIEHWYRQHKLVLADFSDEQRCFLNANSPRDLEAISTHLKGSRQHEGH